jgi:hypothetical protein
VGLPLTFYYTLLRRYAAFSADVPYHEKPGQYILANGVGPLNFRQEFVWADPTVQQDTTGYGLHGDMVSGWEKGVLEGVLKNCPVGSISVAEPNE